MIIPYWEFRYRKNMSDPGRIYMTADYNTIPEVVKAYAVKRSIEVPDDICMRKDFDLIQHVKYVRHR